MRVLIVGPDLPIVGGQTVQARCLIDNFRHNEDVQAEFLPINPIFLRRLQQIKYVRTVITTLKFVYELFRKVPRHDVIHIFSASYTSFLLSPTPALLISKLFGKKTLLNYRSGEADDHLTRWRSAVPTIRLFDRIITPSGYLVDVFRKHGLVADAIFNVVDTNKFQWRNRMPLRPIFLSNRNLEPLYDVETTIRGFAGIQSEISEAVLIVAGEGSQRKSLEALANQLNLRNVEFLGSIPPSDMPSVYSGADVYLNSPKLDNMPNSIIEAFASGLAVVSTNAGGIPYIVDHERNGLLVEVGDHQALARQALRLLADAELAKRLTLEAARDCETYSWKNVGKQWTELYRTLVGPRAAMPASIVDRSIATSLEN